MQSAQQQYGPAPALAVDEFPLCQQYGLGSSVQGFGCYHSLAHPSASAVSWSTTEPTVNVLAVAEQQEQQLWSGAGPGLLCMQQAQEQGGCCFSSSLADDEASQFGGRMGGDAAAHACYADYPHAPATMSPQQALESVPFSLPASAMDLGQWQVYLSHFVPAMQVVDSFADLTSEQRQQAIKFASDMALSQAAAGVHHQPCLQQVQEDGLWHQQQQQRSGMLDVDGCGSWNYGFAGEHQLVTTAVLPTYLGNQGEQTDLGVSQTSDEFRCRFSSSKHYFQYEPGQGCDGGGAPPFLAQDIQQQQQQQQHPFFASSSECVREANSSGSDNLIGESASNLSTNWRAVTAMHAIAAAPEFSTRVELPDESSSVANDDDNLDSTLPSQFKRVPQLDPIDTLSCGSWIAQCKASDSESSGSMQEAGKNFDPAIWNAPAPSLINANTLPAITAVAVTPEDEDVAAFKRQRLACYTLESLSKAVNLHLEKEALAAGTIKSTPRVTALGRPVLFGDADRTRDFSLANRRVFPQDTAPPVFQSAIMEQRESGDAKPCYRKIPATSVEPQSVAARQRRKKISERVRVLEQLIPGGHKMDTASMLDEAIEYVKFLQLQVNILESLGSITDQAHSPAISSSSNNGYGFDLVRDAPLEGGPGHALKSSPLLSVRPSGACPLIMSEVLQQQLFKHKLCIVSLRQCALPSSSS